MNLTRPLPLTVGDLTWQESASCRGRTAVHFYPPPLGERKHERLSRERRAKVVCSDCQVRSSCLEHAIHTGERHGVWGGLNESERALLVAQRNARGA